VVIVREPDGLAGVLQHGPGADGAGDSGAGSGSRAVEERSRISRRCGERVSSRCATCGQRGAFISTLDVQCRGGVGLGAFHEDWWIARQSWDKEDAGLARGQAKALQRQMLRAETLQPAERPRQRGFPATAGSPAELDALTGVFRHRDT